MIENQNIICIASNYWYDPTSKHQVMNRLAAKNHVIWVNYHGSRRPTASVRDVSAITNKLRQVIEGPRRVHDNLTVITPMVVPLPGNSAVAKLNAQLLTRQIRAVLRDLPRRPVQLWTFAPDVDYLCGQFDESCVVYYCVDEFSQFTGYDVGAILAAERRLALQSDLVVVTSRQLLEAKRPISRRIELLPHGVDVEHFATAHRDEVTIPEDVAHLPRPILGFWGLIQDWVDIDLLVSIARQRPDWSMVLIGEAATDVSKLEQLPNVHLLGRRDYQQLPAYAKAMDVGLIPFRLNPLTAAVNPIKLREYLAAGLPVVSTPLPEVCAYQPFVSVGSTADAWVRACEAAFCDDARQAEQRMHAMQAESWDAKVELLSDLVTATVEGCDDPFRDVSTRRSKNTPRLQIPA